jgi:hypothetical protein
MTPEGIVLNLFNTWNQKTLWIDPYKYSRTISASRLIGKA